MVSNGKLTHMKAPMTHSTPTTILYAYDILVFCKVKTLNTIALKKNFLRYSKHLVWSSIVLSALFSMDIYPLQGPIILFSSLVSPKDP